MEDPFQVVHKSVLTGILKLKLQCSEVEKSLQSIQTLFGKFQAQQKARASQPQLKHTLDEIQSSLKTIEWDIQDLEETVRIVESNPARFKLTQQEVSRRRAFVE